MAHIHHRDKRVEQPRAENAFFSTPHPGELMKRKRTMYFIIYLKMFSGKTVEMFKFHPVGSHQRAGNLPA